MNENETPIEGEIVPVQSQQSGLSLGSMPMADPTEIVLRATEIAKVLTKVIKDQRLSRNIQGREYVYVTGWSTLGAMLGIMARETPGGTFAREDGSYVGSVDLIRVSDGMVIGGGTAVVGMDEVDGKGNRTWGSRPEYARRSMAVTRAAGKAYRLTLAWIMALAGFEGTPAEEMDGITPREEEGYSKPKPVQASPRPVSASKPAQADQPHAETPNDAENAPYTPEQIEAKMPPMMKALSEMDGKELFLVQTWGPLYMQAAKTMAKPASKHFENRWKSRFGVKNIRDINYTLTDFLAMMADDYAPADAEFRNDGETPYMSEDGGDPR